MKTAQQLQKEEEIAKSLEIADKKRHLKEEERKVKLEAMAYDFIFVSSCMSKEGPIYLFKRDLPIGTTYIKKHGPYWQVYSTKMDKNKKITINTKNYDSDYHKELRFAMGSFHAKIKAHLKEVSYAEECMWNTIKETET